MQGADNYILWTGDPYDADINIHAIYEAENIQFSDLEASSNTNASSPLFTGKIKTYRGPVWVVANLRDKLMHPSITFDIELPPNSEMRNDAGAGFVFRRSTGIPVN